MSGHAARFAAAEQRKQDSKSGLRDFAETLPYVLDDFQVTACRSLMDGDSVLVAAPTGSGKTLVGEFAAHLAMKSGRRLFYTTPIKALSNQKFREFQTNLGAENVGLLTGDNSINPGASIVIMTTEVLRNMLYSADERLADLQFVVMDEVHYLADRFRGAVWEEVMIHLPAHVRLVCLSATVSNAEEFGEWLTSIRGAVSVIVEEHRPIPLDQFVFFEDELFSLFDRQRRLNAELRARTRRSQLSDRHGPKRHTGPRYGSRPSRFTVIETLQQASMLPAIYFIFSRNGCDGAVEQCQAAGLRLTTHDEKLKIRGIVDDMCSAIPEADLGVLGWLQWRECLEAGFASHHAGLIPLFKEVVERLFQTGLLKVVFATETLALGINMPARTVVIEKLSKWNGESHVQISAGEYTQLTGRAGRRGIDIEGNSVVVWSDNLNLEQVASLASTRTYPLMSSFRPSYNMAINLIQKFGVDQAIELLEKSFAQFQVEMRMRDVSDHIDALDLSAGQYEAQMECHLGDFAEYFELRTRLSAQEKQISSRASANLRQSIDTQLQSLARGDIVIATQGRRSGFVVVLEPAKVRSDDAPRPLVIGLDRSIRRVGTQDFNGPPDVVARISISSAQSERSPKTRKELALRLRDATSQLTIERKNRSSGATDESLIALRAELRNHACHGCHDREEHARWAQLQAKSLRESSQLQKRIDSRAGSLGKQFERICAVLTALGYLKSGSQQSITHAGEILARIYADLDLLTAEVLRDDLLDGLSISEVVGVAAFLAYEPRREVVAAGEPLSSANLRRVLPEIYSRWSAIVDIELTYGVTTHRPLDTGFIRPAMHWARGADLSKVLKSADMPAGDFVRWVKQVIDLLVHIREASPHGGALAAAADEAIGLLDRDLVALAPAG